MSETRIALSGTYHRRLTCKLLVRNNILQNLGKQEASMTVDVCTYLRYVRREGHPSISGKRPDLS